MADDLDQAVRVTYKDVNGDGLTDAVFTFVQKDVAKRLVAGMLLHDVWLTAMSATSAFLPWIRSPSSSKHFS